MSSGCQTKEKGAWFLYTFHKSEYVCVYVFIGVHISHLWMSNQTKRGKLAWFLYTYRKSECAYLSHTEARILVENFLGRTSPTT